MRAFISEQKLKGEKIVNKGAGGAHSEAIEEAVTTGSWDNHFPFPKCYLSERTPAVT